MSPIGSLQVSQVTPLFQALSDLKKQTATAKGSSSLAGQLAAQLASYSQKNFDNDLSQLHSGDDSKVAAALSDLTKAYASVGTLVAQVLSASPSANSSGLVQAANELKNSLSALNVELPSPSSSAGSTDSSSTGGSSAGSSAAAGTGAGGAAATGSIGVLPTPTGKTLTNAEIKSDLDAVLAEHQPILSNRALGRPTSVALWTPAKVDSLRRGIEAAQAFYPGINVHNLARLIIAQGAQESSGDFKLNVGGGPGDGQGFLQVTNQSSLKMFQQFGTPIKSADGKVVVNPKGPIDLADPGQNVAIAAWYSRNALSLGQSPDEKYIWGNTGTVADANKDYGNALFTWNQGPHNDRHSVAGGLAFADYHARISDYFVTAGFGTSADFEKLIGTKIPSTTVDSQG